MSRPKRIFFIASQLGLGGAERQLFYLVSHLDRSKYDVFIVNMSGGGGYYWEERLQELGIRVERQRKATSWQRAWALRSAARSWGADIVQAAHFHVNGYAAIAGWPGAPAIGALRNAATAEHIDRVPAYWKHLCLFGVDRLICNSAMAAQQLTAAYPRLKNVGVIANAVEAPSDADLALTRQRSEQELNKRPGQTLIGFVGHLGEQKNPLLLLQAFAPLAERFAALRLVMVGDGPMRAILTQAAHDLGVTERVDFLGYRPVAEDLMPAFDILCMPSNYEGMPNVLMEAGARGVPVVATEVGGVPEIIVDGVTGLLCPAGDLAALSERLNRLLLQPNERAAMGKAARQRIQEHFQVDRLVGQYTALYEEQYGCQKEGVLDVS